MPYSDIKELLTRKEVEQTLKISRSQIYNFLRSGRLTAYKIGGSLRFQKDDINRLIKLHPYSPKRGSKEKRASSRYKKKGKFKKPAGKTFNNKKGGRSKLIFEKARKYSSELDLEIDNQAKIYKLGDLLKLDYKDFGGENPHIASAKLKRLFLKAIEERFSINQEQAEEIASLIDTKLKEFGRRIFIRNIQKQS